MSMNDTCGKLHSNMRNHSHPSKMLFMISKQKKKEKNENDSRGAKEKKNKNIRTTATTFPKRHRNIRK